MKKNIVSLDGAYSTGSIVFNVRKMILPRTNKEGQTKVYVEVLHYEYQGTGKYTSKFKRISTKVWIYPKNWNRKKEEITVNEPDYNAKNNSINSTYSQVQHFIASKGEQQTGQAYIEDIDLETLREFFPTRPENRKTLVDYFDQYIEKRKVEGTIYNTLKEFTTVKNRISNYDLFNEKKTFTGDVNILWSESFYLYLKTLYSEGTIEKTYTVLYTVLSYYYDLRDELRIDLTDKFKSKRFKRGTKSRNAADPLTEQQLITLRDHVFDQPHMKLIQDRFTWQCYTGIRYIDAFRITKKDIKNGWLRFMPSKTHRHGVKVEQPLNSIASHILEKYECDMSRLKITNQAYNRELKDLFKILQEKYPELHYRTDYGTYCSRDTYISMCVQGGANWKDILKWVGQSSYAIMDRYIKTEDRTQMDSVNHIFKNKS
jgi:hypothetical protein